MSALGRLQAPPQAPDARDSADAPPITVWGVLEAVFNLFALNALMLLLCLTVVGAPLALRAAVVAIDRWRRDGDDRLARSFVSALRAGPWLAPWITVAVPMAAIAIATAEVRFFYRRLDVMGGLCTGLGLIGVIVAFAVLGQVTVSTARDGDLSGADAWQRALREAARAPVRVTLPVVVILAGAAYLLMADPSLAVVGLPLAALCAARRLIDRGVAGRSPVDEPTFPEPTVKEVNTP